MGELGSPFRARRVVFLLLFLLMFLLLSTRVVIIFVTLVVRVPLLLAFAPLASSSSTCSCAPLGIEYISVVTWKTTNKAKVSRLNSNKME